ncbi:Carbohydrate deacetylase YdjC-like [Bartonella choladocola]|uniref:ChbG/HpnK family deacetylase n=1 Tax=Bartonella choladocola TaxID=2750995 RepID=UPI003997AC40
MTLFCLFNADDFALDLACSNAVIKGVERGRLQATSVLSGGEDQASFEQLDKTGCKFINVHLNLLEGKALTKGGSEFGLTGNDDFFHLSLGELITKLYLSPQKKRLREWIFKEFCQQIEFVYDHFPERQMRLDGHLHIHILPPLRTVIEKLLIKYPIRYIRTPSERGYSRQAPFISNMKGCLRRQLLGFWAKDIGKLARRYQVATSDFFLGTAASCNLTLDDIDRGLSVISRAAGNCDAQIEIMVHPLGNDISDSHFYKDSRYGFAHATPERRNELTLLLSDDLINIMKKYNAVFEK